MKIRRTDEDVVRCGLLVAEGYNVFEVEQLLNIPHSTVHWVILNRLQNLDAQLYDQCIYVFVCHKHKVVPRTVYE